MRYFKHLLLFVSLLTLSGCGIVRPSTSSNSSSESKPHEFTLSDAPYYVDEYNEMNDSYSAKRKATFTYGFYSDQPYVIYMTLDTALNELFETGVTKQQTEVGFTYTTPVGSIWSVNKDTSSITVTNYESMNLFSTKYDTEFGLIDEETTTHYVKSEGSIIVDDQLITFDLREYNMSIVEYQGNLYIPFSVLNYMTFNWSYWSSVAFNGSAFYFIDILSGAFGLGAPQNTYARQFYYGAFNSKNRDRYFAEHNYYAFMFMLDHYYGFLDERFAPWDTYLTNNNPSLKEALMSNDEATYSDAVDKLINSVIGDGHTNSYNGTSAFGSGSYSSHYYSSDREDQLSDDYWTCASARYDRFGYNVPALRFSGDTAIITFDGFNHAGYEFTSSNINGYKNYDSFALFHYAFEQINARSDINNVIFDITCNGGGDTNALVPMLGFLTDDVHIQQYSPLTKAHCDLHYRIDINLDGVYDANDTFKDRYNFYVLTSNYSFSCANLFPGVCKKEGYAKIIGQKSGGGACVVYYTSTPDGKPFRISGNMRECGDNGYSSHFDSGVAVDYTLPASSFYDDTALVNLVDSISN